MSALMTGQGRHQGLKAEAERANLAATMDMLRNMAKGRLKGGGLGLSFRWKSALGPPRSPAVARRNDPQPAVLVERAHRRGV